MNFWVWIEVEVGVLVWVWVWVWVGVGVWVLFVPKYVMVYLPHWSLLTTNPDKGPLGFVNVVESI